VWKMGGAGERKSGKAGGLSFEGCVHLRGSLRDTHFWGRFGIQGRRAGGGQSMGFCEGEGGLRSYM